MGRAATEVRDDAGHAVAFVALGGEVDFLGRAARRLAPAEVQDGRAAAADRLVRLVRPGIVAVDRARRRAEHVLHR